MHLDLSDNYFELFGIAPDFRIDLDRVENRYRELQSLLHPDRHVTSSAREKRLAAQGASQVNQAYAVLTDDCDRAAYLLALGQRQPSAPESSTVDDPEFLIEQMELRERLEQTGGTSDEGKALQRLLDQTAERMRTLCSDFGDAYTAGQFDDARGIVHRMRFVRKFHDEVADRLHRFRSRST